MRFNTSIVLALLALCLSTAAHEARAADHELLKFALHIVPKPAKGAPPLSDGAPQGGYGCAGQCSHCPGPWGSNLLCTADTETPSYLYLVLLDVDVEPGVSGVTVHVEYDEVLGRGIDIFQWHSFAPLETPDATWPLTSPTGTVLRWNNTTECQRAVDPADPQGEAYVVAYGFYVYAYSADQFKIANGEPQSVLNCELEESHLFWYGAYGIAGFGVSGWDPCLGNCGGKVGCTVGAAHRQ